MEKKVLFYVIIVVIRRDGYRDPLGSRWLPVR